MNVRAFFVQPVEIPVGPLAATQVRWRPFTCQSHDCQELNPCSLDKLSRPGSVYRLPAGFFLPAPHQPPVAQAYCLPQKKLRRPVTQPSGLQPSTAQQPAPAPPPISPAIVSPGALRLPAQTEFLKLHTLPRRKSAPGNNPRPASSKPSSPPTARETVRPQPGVAGGHPGRQAPPQEHQPGDCFAGRADFPANQSPRRVPCSAAASGKIAKVAKAAILKPPGNRRFCWGFGVRLPRLPRLPRLRRIF